MCGPTKAARQLCVSLLKQPSRCASHHSAARGTQHGCWRAAQVRRIPEGCAPPPHPPPHTHTTTLDPGSPSRQPSSHCATVAHATLALQLAAQEGGQLVPSAAQRSTAQDTLDTHVTPVHLLPFHLILLPAPCKASPAPPPRSSPNHGCQDGILPTLLLGGQHRLGEARDGHAAVGHKPPAPRPQLAAGVVGGVARRPEPCALLGGVCPGEVAAAQLPDHLACEAREAGAAVAAGTARRCLPHMCKAGQGSSRAAQPGRSPIGSSKSEAGI